MAELEFSGGLRELSRIAVHPKIVTGTYILQTNRHSFNQNQVDPLCLLCKGANETIAHFLMDCTTLEITRQLFGGTNRIGEKAEFKPNTHTVASSGAERLNFDLSLHLHPYYEYASSEGSGNTECAFVQARTRLSSSPMR